MACGPEESRCSWVFILILRPFALRFLVLTATGLHAALLPIQRAASIESMEALRTEQESEKAAGEAVSEKPVT